MLVKCINNDGVEKYLTVGKLYEVSESRRNYTYRLRDDTGTIWRFMQSRFEKAGSGDQGSNDQTEQDAR